VRMVGSQYLSVFQDIEATLWLEAHLSSDESGRTIVITSHDQDFLDNVVEETIYIRDQQLKHFDGTPTALQVEERKKTRRMKTMSEAMDKKKEHVSLTLYMQRSVPIG
jgi:ATP-binding cassette subfamily F protein 3